MWDFSIPANDMIEMAEGQKLAPGASIQALASAISSVNVFVSGVEEALLGA